MTPSLLSGSLRYFRTIALIWLALGITTATQIVFGMRAVGMQHDWAVLFFASCASWLVWALGTPVVLALSHRFAVVGAGGWKRVPIHCAAALVIGVSDAAWAAALEWFFNPLALTDVPSYRYLAITAFYSRFHIGLVIYAAIVAVAHTMDSLERLARRDAEAARLSAELSKAQIDALRRQLEPHFLFNTLNGISGLVRENQNQAAIGMIAGLSEMLRRLLEDSGRQLVPLAEELSFLDSYIDLQLMRFGGRLKVTVDVPVDLYAALVPAFILQPIVENAIVHGIAGRPDGGIIRVSAHQSAGILTISVHNDGPALSAVRAGVGLSNTEGRLATLYGDSGSVELRNHLEAGVETVIRVPWRIDS